VFSEPTSSQSCWQGTAGAVGRGRLAAIPPAHPPSARREGWLGALGGVVTLEMLGENETCYLSVSPRLPMGPGDLLRDP
jgi:hypothetical protein